MSICDIFVYDQDLYEQSNHFSTTNFETGLKLSLQKKGISMESKRYATCPTCGRRTVAEAKPLKRDLSLIAFERASKLLSGLDRPTLDKFLKEI